MGKAEARPKGYGGGRSSGGGGSPGKIFVGGLPRDTSDAMFVTHFGQYGEIVDSVIMKDKLTSQPRGFGFITYAKPAVVDKVLEATHIINGKQVEIKRTIPKGSMQSDSKDFKTRKIFVGGLPSTLTEDDFKSFFAKYGAVVDHQIMRHHETKRSRGFGFIVFASEQTVDDLLAKGNMIDLAGSKVEIKKAEPKKSSNPSKSDFSRNSELAYDSDHPRVYPSADTYSGLPSIYCSHRSGGFDPHISDGGVSGRLSMYGRMGGFGGEYGRYYEGLEGYGGRPPFCYPGCFGPYGGGFDGAYARGGISGYMGGGADESFGGPGTSGFGDVAYGRPYDSALGDGSTSYGRLSFNGRSGRYHPYGP